ncbi:MAG: hypothetical protein JOZ44_11235 [Acidobacteria bacterium]|nr:hypothetical protein [Acidobacteriota bacterium]
MRFTNRHVVLMHSERSFVLSSALALGRWSSDDMVMIHLFALQVREKTAHVGSR